MKTKKSSFIETNDQMNDLEIIEHTSVEHSEGLAPERAHFHNDVNDIDIYVEDTKNLNMWTSILRVFLPTNINFSHPIRLEGKLNVIKEL